MFYFKFFEVSISCLRKYCLYHAESMKRPPSQARAPAPLFLLRIFIQKQLNYSLLSYILTPWEMLQVAQDFARYLRGGTMMNEEDVLQDRKSAQI